jgi:NTE family protein
LGFLDKKEEPAEKVLEANLGKLGIMYEMFETMQASLTQYKIAGYRPDLLIKIPKNSAKVYEFYNADQQIDLGYKITLQALDAFERGEANTYGQI